MKRPLDLRMLRRSQPTRRAALAVMAQLSFQCLNLVACEGGEPGDLFAEAGVQQPAIPRGQLTLGLVGQSSNGAGYRLRNALIMVQGPDRTLFFDTEQEPDATSLSADVAPGSYSLFLQDGWFLQGVSDGVMAMAVLVGANPSQLTVSSGENTQVPLRLRLAGDIASTEPGSFDIVLDVAEPQGPRPEFCSSDADCARAEVCCSAGSLGRCQAAPASGACPLPDLTIAAEATAASFSIGSQTFASNSCAIDEGCVGAPGPRRLLRFDTMTPNTGEADVILGDPREQPGFELSQCHEHFHFSGYLRYELLDTSGTVVAIGQKRAFCLLDSRQLSSATNPLQRFDCGFQGLTRGWAARYESEQDCQWLDITGVPADSYLLRLSVNPDRVIVESDYDNNTVEIPVLISDPSEPVGACNGPGGDPTATRCEWSFEPDFQGATCTPGEEVALGCGCRCTGAPMLRICEGSADCTNDTQLAFNDDSCQLCPALQFTCPRSGVFSALTRPFDLQPSSCALERL